MDFLEFSRKRFSVRSYSARQVEDEKIQKILQPAMIAPTAVNYQPQKIYVLKSDEALRPLHEVLFSGQTRHQQRPLCLSRRACCPRLLGLLVKTGICGDKRYERNIRRLHITSH